MQHAHKQLHFPLWTSCHCHLQLVCCHCHFQFVCYCHLRLIRYYYYLQLVRCHCHYQLSNSHSHFQLISYQLPLSAQLPLSSSTHHFRCSTSYRVYAISKTSTQQRKGTSHHYYLHLVSYHCHYQLNCHCNLQFVILLFQLLL